MARVKWVTDEEPAAATPSSSPPSSPPVNPVVDKSPPTPEPQRRSLRNIEKASVNAFQTRWDDWVPQDRLRKLTEDNRELAASLRRDVMQAESRQRNTKPSTSSKKGRAQGSEIGSGRGSEERHSSVPAGGRGTKRGKDNEIEKVDIPAFLLPRKDPRTQKNGSPVPPSFPLSSERTTAGYDEEKEIEVQAPPTPFGAGLSSGIATGFNKERIFKLPDAPKGKAAASSQGVKTMASGTIHGRYDPTNGVFVPGSRGKPEVISRRGLFHDGEFSSAELAKATNTKYQADSRLSRRPEAQGEQNDEPLVMPDEATCTDEEMFNFVMKVLSKPPPPDEPEHMTVDSFNHGYHWAPLIGGTTENEKMLIEEEAQAAGMSSSRPQVHPQYEKCRVNDPLNSNRLLFFENQDRARKLMIAGVPKDPIHIDPPGCGTPFDALKFPDLLVKLPPKVLGALTMDDLQKLDRATILRFPTSALKMLPPKFLSKLKISIPSENDVNNTDFQEESFLMRPSVHIPVPDMIKGYLVDDWENVTKSLTLVELPSKAPVNWILDTYFHEEKGKRRLGSAEADRLVEMVDGMKTYFERMLGKTLLYKFERGQYAEV